MKIDIKIDLEYRLRNKVLSNQLDVLKCLMYNDKSFDEYGYLKVYKELGFERVFEIVKICFKLKYPLSWIFERYAPMMKIKTLDGLKMYYELNGGWEDE